MSNFHGFSVRRDYENTHISAVCARRVRRKQKQTRARHINKRREK